MNMHRLVISHIAAILASCVYFSHTNLSPHNHNFFDSTVAQFIYSYYDGISGIEIKCKENGK